MTETREPYVLPVVPDYDADWRDWLRQELSSWPFLTPHMHAFLTALHWRQRASVCAIYGDRLTFDQATARIGVSERTIRSDIDDVCCLLRAWPR